MQRCYNSDVFQMVFSIQLHSSRYFYAFVDYLESPCLKRGAEREPMFVQCTVILGNIESMIKKLYNYLSKSSHFC